jgi:hypothetical protein
MVRTPPASASRRPPRLRWLVLGLVLIAAILAMFWTPLNGFARTGAAYGARVACSCRYLGGRDIGDCRKDFEPGMELVLLSEDKAERSVTATFPLLASETARLHKGEGCRLDPWDD